MVPIVALGALAWVAAVVAAFGALQHYAATEGAAYAPSPRAQEILRKYWQPGHGLVVMAVHPLCPCTSASLSELGDLLARSEGRCRAIVVEYQPEHPSPDWESSPNTIELGGKTVPVIMDRGGVLATSLGAATSGHLVFVDPQGKIQFHGGLTIARGHRGRSPAQDAILASLKGGDVTLKSAPVYGCSLTAECSAPSHP
jgi:hypothetical protein